ncbi:MAG TPA: glycosyltransferase family 2 protein [Lichenihabitans sp.]|jgi:glycosyltransferase involved in cell wall biosynthesis|nr:glycosyltransferase family 2 protein [Lichenihabitans sp.]
MTTTAVSENATAAPLRPEDWDGLGPSVPRRVRGAAARPRIAVLVPCYNEEMTVAAVVEGFRSALPDATVYVYDNNSRDATAARARDAGAVVRVERRQGKGHVLRRMFADVEADLYILVDGDDTYDCSVAPTVVERIVEGGLDFVNVARISTATEAYRPGHKLGNRVLTQIVRTIFGRESSDMLSGYKGLSRRFVKSFPALSSGFETETELTVHALELRMPMGELPAPYKERPTGSTSKLRTYRDGWRILMLISRLVRDERPMRFFGWLGLAVVACGLLLGLPVVADFLATGLVPRLPTAVLSVGVIVLGWLSIFAGIILDMMTKARHEMKRLAYLSIPKYEP